jgi:hypothetical protein
MTVRVVNGVIHALGIDADLSGVRATPGFSHVLDDKLAAVGVVVARPTTKPSVATQPGGHVWGIDPPRAARPIAGAEAAFRAAYQSVILDRAPGQVASTETAKAGPSVAASASSRRLRVTTPQQRAALAQLRSLGASELGPDLADVELKHAFRTLARRFHPDRHPGLAPEQRKNLAARFAEAADAYRILIATQTV